MLNYVKKVRQDLHQIPELELNLPKTQAYILHELESLPCQVESPIASSVIAYFDNHKDSTIAFRSDMDALPVSEKNEVPYKSQHEGKMHACGHDGHMATLLGFAKCLPEHLSEINHNILLVFQPGEESPGGAHLLVESGIFEKYHVQEIFGLHLWPDLKAGTIATRKNEFMAHSSEVHVDVEGLSSHVAKAALGKDAMAAACEFLLDVYAFEKSYPDSIYRLCKFGLFQSGTVCNAISAHSHLEGTMRAFQDEVFYGLQNKIIESAHTMEKKYGVTFHVQFKNGYPPVMNDPTLTQKVLDTIPNIQVLDEPEMIAEAFAYYQTILPGTFFFLGTGTGIPLHADTWDFDENILEKGIQLFLDLAKL